jgi:TRAP-type C4-dicarboxylate transport system substrate-binding protein
MTALAEFVARSLKTTIPLYRRYRMKRLTCLLAAALLGLTLSACRKEEGPAEKAGKEADKAIKEAGQAMEKAADAVKEATKGSSK